MPAAVRFVHGLNAVLLSAASLGGALTARADDAPAAPAAPAPLPAAPPTREEDDDAITPLPDTKGPSSVPSSVPETDVFSRRRLAIEAHLGFATPVGALGAVVEYSVTPFLGLGAGFGVGSGPEDGNNLHGALLTRFRPFRGKTNALELGAAYSFGGFRKFELNIGDSPPPNVADRADWAHWAQFDIGWEHRAEKGFLMRLSLGGAVLLDPADLQCGSSFVSGASSCAPTDHETLFTLDLAIGYAALL